ncbi:translation initiation factor IF-2 [Prosthecobacter debontii]|uniref:Translation initiation factor IF-2 n=1 Tax=Prosthecobacter debontii TaxID=48467 RepID=A0A1T4Z0C5_9BACT|nr:translation initiation factor IF-2 [Prosthecobacter debontii]SKB07474.1 translation initiation factor IF-2 [Prosthecobacter debontii]
MPSRSSSSKPAKTTPDSPADASGQAESTAQKKPGAKKVLDLIEEDDKPKSRTPRRDMAPLPHIGAKPAPVPAKASPAKAAEAPKKTLDDHKREALNLFEEGEKPKVRRRPADQSTSLPPISTIREPGPVAAMPAPPAPMPVAAPAPKPESAAPEFETNDAGEKIIHLKPPIIVKELAEKMGLRPFKVIADLIALKVFVANADKAIEIDVAEKVCEKHGFHLEREKREKGAGVHKVEEVIVEPAPQVVEEVEEDKLELRAPIITFMGHVDHGKTSLLDAIRKTHVVTGEAGGITQHIGAYSVFHDGKPITFIDTPGHAAFSGMRARGANVTDIVILVVAADDGIMPQTREALNHAKAADVTIMVAINKCDLPAANIMRVKSQLQDIGLAPVDWGGDTECMEVSAKSGQGIESLLETMALQAEVLELKADPKAPARATVIESSMVEGKGPVATVIVRQGTLKVGQPFICGPHWGKSKALINDRGAPIKEVRPGMPVELVGFSDMPHVGDEVVVMDSERSVKKLSEERLEETRQKKLAVTRRSTLESLFNSIDEGNKKTLKLVLKADVQGSVEAIVKCLGDITSDKINQRILHSDVGPITESDVLLASGSDAIIIGFNTKVENKALSVAKREGVQIKLYSIIYELVDQVKDAMTGLLDPLTREKVLGHAKVKQVFKVNRGYVGGSLVTDGRIDRKQRARVLRDGQAVYDGSIETLRRFQDEVPEVRNGLECGIKLQGFSDYEEGDVIECYELEKFAQSL